MWDLIVSVPDHCLSFYFVDVYEPHSHWNRLQRPWVEGVHLQEKLYPSVPHSSWSFSRRQILKSDTPILYSTPQYKDCGTSVVVPYCSCCLCLYFGSSIMLVTYFVNFR